MKVPLLSKSNTSGSTGCKYLGSVIFAFLLSLLILVAFQSEAYDSYKHDGEAAVAGPVEGLKPPRKGYGEVAVGPGKGKGAGAPPLPPGGAKPKLPSASTQTTAGVKPKQFAKFAKEQPRTLDQLATSLPAANLGTIPPDACIHIREMAACNAKKGCTWIETGGAKGEFAARYFRLCREGNQGRYPRAGIEAETTQYIIPQAQMNAKKETKIHSCDWGYREPIGFIMYDDIPLVRIEGEYYCKLEFPTLDFSSDVAHPERTLSVCAVIAIYKLSINFDTKAMKAGDWVPLMQVLSAIDPSLAPAGSQAVNFPTPCDSHFKIEFLKKAGGLNSQKPWNELISSQNIGFPAVGEKGPMQFFYQVNAGLPVSYFRVENIVNGYPDEIAFDDKLKQQLFYSGDMIPLNCLRTRLIKSERNADATVEYNTIVADTATTDSPAAKGLVSLLRNKRWVERLKQEDVDDSGEAEDDEGGASKVKPKNPMNEILCDDNPDHSSSDKNNLYILPKSKIHYKSILNNAVKTPYFAIINHLKDRGPTFQYPLVPIESGSPGALPGNNGAGPVYFMYNQVVFGLFEVRQQRNALGAGLTMPAAWTKAKSPQQITASAQTFLKLASHEHDMIATLQSGGEKEPSGVLPNQIDPDMKAESHAETAIREVDPNEHYERRY